MNSLEILHAIWGRGLHGAYAFMPMKHGHTWHELDAVVIYELTDFTQPGGFDVYFTPARYERPERSEEATSSLGVLYADLDDKYDPQALEKYPPSILWETSPGSYQAVWFKSTDMVDFELNHRMSLFMKADHGSWIPTKVLRVPGTINYKRGGIQGTLHEFHPEYVYHEWELMDELPELPEGISWHTMSKHPEVPDDKQWRALMDKWWGKFDHRTKQMLLTSEVSDRSMHLALLAKRMVRISVPPHEIFGILSKLATNKFANRPQTLWESVVLSAFDQLGSVPEAALRQ